MMITVPEERLNVVEEADLCVIGGSCTGVFAAVRAAELGAKVVLIEQQNRLGGVATTGLVGMWHTVFDMTGEKQIIGGLTWEMMERLEKRRAISPDFRDPAASRRFGVRFNSEELTLELDQLVREHPAIHLYLHTRFSRVVCEEPGKIDAVILENKSGRFAIRAKMFLDASGDGVLCREAGLAVIPAENPQPPTTCARFGGWDTLGPYNLQNLIEKYRSELPDLPCGYYWDMFIPGSNDIMFAGTRILNCNCADGAELTRAELEGRRQLRAIIDMFRREFPDNRITLASLPSMIGIRETGHISSIAGLHGKDLLAGVCFEDTIGRGTYPVDIHSNKDNAITFWQLDGTKTTWHGNENVKERWLPEGEILPFYNIPLSCLIPQNAKNLIAAGRLLDADPMAFGAVRVMVNLNQCGEAAGVAAFQALHPGIGIAEIDRAETRRLLSAGGSLLD